jgi:APA family basic amino acid/polyamine antiporter
VLVLTGSATALTTYTGFSIILFNGIAVAALFVLRRREPDAPRPYSTWGYPVVPGIFVIVSAVIVANALWTDLGRPLTAGTPVGPSAAGLIIIALGLPLYAWFTRNAPRA